MKDSYRSISLIRFCRLLGVTRQAFYQHTWRSEEISVEAELVIQQVIAIRKRHPVIGTRKLYVLLQPFLLEHQIKTGRDKLFDLLADYHLLIKRRRRRVSTTQSYHRFHKYPNLVKEIELTGINQLWVSDITFYKLKEKFVYISFITDAYSHKIIGYQLAQTLEAVHSIAALQMALQNLPSTSHTPVHHSDRGMQYCCDNYAQLLQEHAIPISMTENGDPLENAIAERVNGIIKHEYLNHRHYGSINELEEALQQSVNLYNTERPHMSCSMFTPEMVQQNHLSINREWKTSYKSQKPLAIEE